MKEWATVIAFCLAGLAVSVSVGVVFYAILRNNETEER